MTDVTHRRAGNGGGVTSAQAADRVRGLVIEGIEARIIALQRRYDYLRDFHERKQSSNPKAADYDREEMRGLDGGIKALRHHRRELEGEAAASHLLAELLDAIGGAQTWVVDPALISRAEKVLDDIEG